LLIEMQKSGNLDQGGRIAVAQKPSSEERKLGLSLSGGSEQPESPGPNASCESTYHNRVRNIMARARIAGTAEVATEAEGDSGVMEGEMQACGSSSKASSVKTRDLEQLLERQGWRCALTGAPLHPRNAALDHKIPVERGGKHILANLQWVTPQVNKAKGTMTNEEFVTLCDLVVKHMEQPGG
jgi:5-methylcytosine-specific restriction endonuclease McrA